MPSGTENPKAPPEWGLRASEEATNTSPNHCPSSFAAGRIPAHDVAVGRALARVLCGGAGEATPSELDEQQILDLEREAFLELCGTSATAERVAHMLNTGKPLRN